MNISQEEERKNKAEAEILQMSCIAMGNTYTMYRFQFLSLSLLCYGTKNGD